MEFIRSNQTSLSNIRNGAWQSQVPADSSFTRRSRLMLEPPYIDISVENGSYYSCAANALEASPNNLSGVTVAIGTERGVRLQRVMNETMTTSKTLRCASNVLVVDWISKNVVAAAQRNGAVKLWDTRIGPEADHGPASAILMQHGSGIDAMQCLQDGNHIVAGGALLPAALYDLRMIRHAEQRDSRLMKKGKPITMATIIYPVNRRTTQRAGLDVSEDLRMLAFSSDNLNGVSLLDLWNGTLLKQLRPESTKRSICETWGCNLKFVKLGPRQEDALIETNSEGMRCWTW